MKICAISVYLWARTLYSQADVVSIGTSSGTKMAMLTESAPHRPRDPGSEAEIHQTGEQVTLAQPGSLACVGCGYSMSLTVADELPQCPNCGGEDFRRTSIFAPSKLNSDAVEVAAEAPEWLAEARAQIGRPGNYLAFEDDDGCAVIRLEPGWTRIGRSAAADLQFDDPTVSRRHALVVLTEAGGVRALDDRSLNGLFVNGERVEWAPLSDGDELEIGRYRVYLLEA